MNKNSIKTSLAVLALCAPLPACTASNASLRSTDYLGSAQIVQANGQPIGSANLLAKNGKVLLTLSVSGVEAGGHGFHLHQTGLCNTPDFESAGGHLNPTAKDHGSLSEGGSHLGDLPNLIVGSDGSITKTIAIHGSRQFILQSVYDNDGTAIIIHAKADDYRTNPSGAAGPRIACGLLSRSK